jgi:hypothetical protein
MKRFARFSVAEGIALSKRSAQPVPEAAEGNSGGWWAGEPASLKLGDPHRSMVASFLKIPCVLIEREKQRGCANSRKGKRSDDK